MGVFWGVRSKECFCFILTGTVLFKFYFDFGVCVCASAPLTGIPYNAKKELCPQRLEHSLRYVLCPCDPQDSSRSFSYPPPPRYPWNPQLPPCSSWSSLGGLALLLPLVGLPQSCLAFPRRRRSPTHYLSQETLETQTSLADRSKSCRFH